MPKKRKISPKLLADAAKKYISDRKTHNIARLASECGIPYSTLRRYLLAYIKDNDLMDNLIEDYLPFEGFEHLRLGDTYQFAEHMTIWLVKDLRKLDGERVFILAPAPTRARRHWVCLTLYEEE